MSTNTDPKPNPISIKAGKSKIINIKEPRGHQARPYQGRVSVMGKERVVEEWGKRGVEMKEG